MIELRKHSSLENVQTTVRIRRRNVLVNKINSYLTDTDVFNWITWNWIDVDRLSGTGLALASNGKCDNSLCTPIPVLTTNPFAGTGQVKGRVIVQYTCAGVRHKCLATLIISSHESFLWKENPVSLFCFWNRDSS